MTRHVAIGTILTAALAAVVTAQAPRPASPAPTQAPGDPLLTEVRALRAELHQATALAIRTQVLVGRLQLQEERIHSLDRQLDATREELAEITRGRAAMAAPLKMLGQSLDTPPVAAADAKEGDAFAPLREIAAAQLAREQELRERESSLAAQLGAEQARWVEFSRQLDDIERALEARR